MTSAGVNDPEPANDGKSRNRGPLERVTVNRALQVYAYLEETMQAGGSIYLRQSPEGELERLRIF